MMDQEVQGIQGVQGEAMLNEEQRLQRIQEEATLQERRNERIQVVQQIADLEKARDLAVNRLRRLINRAITVTNFSIVEENYLNLAQINADLNNRILDWEDLLETDEEENPIYPDRGQPEYRYSPEADDFQNKTRTMEMISSQSIEVLKEFYLVLPAADKITVTQLAQTVFLKNTKDWVPQNIEADQTSDHEEEEHTMGVEEEENVENTRDEEEDAPAPTPVPTRSPMNSIESSKSVMIRGRNYQARKSRISKLISSIEADPEGIHSENLEKQTELINKMLKELDLPGIIALADTEPDFMEIFGETEDQVNDWYIDAKFRTEDLTFRAAKEVSERKAATQTGFKKPSLPSFNGDILNYQQFRRRWEVEVVPEKRPAAMELAALREALPAPAKAKRKSRISKLISSIEADPEGIHSENLEKQTELINKMLKELDMPGIIALADTEPDFMEIFRETEDQVNDCVILYASIKK